MEQSVTVTFKPQLTGANPVISLMDDIVTEQDLEAHYKKVFQAPVKQAYPPSQWWVTRVFHTTSEKPPIKWVPYDSASYETMSGVENGYIEWCDYLKNNSDISGYKVVTMCLDMLNGTGEVAKQFCKEHFHPKEKVYINGPKKKPFPIKAAKHYV